MTYRVRYGNKFGSTKQEVNGIVYHSKKEAAYAQELELRRKAGDIQDWTRQEKIELDVNGYHIANYYVDFKVIHPDGTVEYVEVKGFETPEWKLKWKLFEALYSKDPNLRLTIVK